ncbi:VOC family protein [Sphingobacterium oryzagri]|uniref:VOC family protein n=1 Tax=Sphingobacterium oryzagri TaxID=3025669 RepID=A0ABY7WKZ6_9SPHI|nr:VOC family protein [Sphingobacterium sp. KACC 22765]WDF70263.1 VOC family protein [Sphingobacterium sp. KACC 22765]
MRTNIYPAIWFEKDAEQAFSRYTAQFAQSEIITTNPVVVSAKLKAVPFIGINGGPYFTPNPAISFMVICEEETEINQLWSALSDEGEVLMPLGSYAWSPHYGWLTDKNNVSWQLYQGKLDDVNQQAVVPTLMFCEAQQGRCQEAIAFYQTVFTDFKQQGEMLYPEGPAKGQLMHAQFVIQDFTLMAMDSGVPQTFTFNEGISLVIACADQAEIDYYWQALTKDGQESRCGWCKDPFGVSWQIVPHDIDQILANYPHAGSALMHMSKINVDDLKK